jgi:hypothetical protein
MLRLLLRQPDTRLNRGMNLFWTGFTLLLFLFFFLAEIFSEDSMLEIPVRLTSPAAEIRIEQLPTATIISEGVLRIPEPNIAQRLITSTTDSIIDPVYLLWFIGVIIIYLVFFRDIELKDPFTRRTLTGARVLLILSIVLYLVSGFREYWLHQIVQEYTGKRYSVRWDHLPLVPELFLIVAMRRLVHIARRGYQLTLDQQYTV